MIAAPHPGIAPQASRAVTAPSVNPRINAELHAALDAASVVVPLADVTTAILGEAIETMGAAAAVLLVRAGVDLWRVQAGVGESAAEHRLELTADSWLVQQTIQQQLALVIDDSDLVRERLQGVPLASWRYLAAAPIGGEAAILILASEDTAFDESLVERLVAIGAEAAPLLHQAMLLRHVAQSLHRFA